VTHRTSTLAVLALGLALLISAAFVVIGLALPDDGAVAAWTGHWLSPTGSLLCATAALVWARRAGRFPWVAAGLACGAAAGYLYSALYRNDPSPPSPSLADPLYLAVYPLVIAGFVAQARRQAGRRRTPGQWLDGLIAALVVGAIWTLALLEPLGRASSAGGASPGDVVLTLAYPVADLGLVAALAAVCAMHEWRRDAARLLFGAGVLLYAIADSMWALWLARGANVDGGLVAAAYVAAFSLWALTVSRPDRLTRRGRGRAAALAPAVFGLVSVGMLVGGALWHGSSVSLVLAASAVLATLARFARTSLQNAALLAATRDEADTDPLTGLGNRRSLEVALDAAAGPHAVVLFDLDGFKLYNDTFGHPAGDLLLRRIADLLVAALGGDGGAYRVGGDEFCVVAPFPADGDPDALGARLAEAMTVTGDGFHVGASFGAMPLTPGTSSADALSAADRRLYQHKHRGRLSARRQSADVLLAVLAERIPEFRRRGGTIAESAVRVGERLGMGQGELDQLREAAALHDIGKLAVPDAILHKSGRLSHDEWALLRRHPLIGQRVLDAAPSLASVGAIVRATHERYDGQGYPDRVAGAAIPLAARIIFVCNAYEAMRLPRPHRPARDLPGALAELRRCAGTQFDPGVVAAFCATHEHEEGTTGLTRDETVV
jgi:diguanylate cyclase (GGDEF)-like protein